MSVKIIADSGCDMTRAEAKEKDLCLLPLKTYIDGVEYLDGETITAEEFYKKLDECKQLPTTSQPTPADFAEAFEKLGEDGSELLVITISGKLSGTVQSATIASENLENIYIVDSENVCVGQRVLVEYALRLRDEGRSAKEIADELNVAKKRVCTLALVDTLEYLMRGGRLSRTSAIAGTVLNIKPVLGIIDGEAKVLGKARGSKNSNNLLNDTINKRGGIDFSMPYMLGYSGVDDALLRGYVENSRALWEAEASSLPKCMIGSTIGTHAGPGAIAVGLFVKET